MKTRPILTALTLALLVGVCGEARGQLFGERTVGGSSMNRRVRPGAGQAETDVGTLSGRERFLRENRDFDDFVGSDLDDLPGFIGAAPDTRSSAGRSRFIPPTVRIEATPDANRALQAAGNIRTEMYSPRLRVGFEHPAPTSGDISMNLARQLETSLTRQLQAVSPDYQVAAIGVSMEGETARLTGVVFSERARYLAELLALFEPGISTVENNLTVGPAGSAVRKKQPDEPSRPTNTRSRWSSQW